MLHFSDSEFTRRTAQLEEALDSRGLDGILLFSPESQYWLTGYDTFGFCFFQCLVIGGNEPVLLTRSADRLQAEITSNIRDIRIWVDDEAADPSEDLADLLSELGLDGKRLGIETDTYGLTGMNYQRVANRLDGKVTLTEASNIISSLRLVKSAEEQAYVRTAARLADDALDAAIAVSRPGIDEGQILADMHAAIFKGGGDYPGNEFIIGSAENALLVRYASGTRTLSRDDQLNLEWAGTYRHYHSAMMRTILIGKPDPRHVDMQKAGVEALLECEARLQPGKPMGDVFDAHCRTFARLGMEEYRLNACGYSLGARFTPTWMEREMFRAGASTIMVPGMVLFLHMILLDRRNRLAMCTGRTSLVTGNGSEVLSQHGLDLLNIR